MAETEMEVCVIPNMRVKENEDSQVFVSKKSYYLNTVPETEMEDQNFNEVELELLKAARNGDKSKAQKLLGK